VYEVRDKEMDQRIILHPFLYRFKKLQLEFREEYRPVWCLEEEECRTEWLKKDVTYINVLW
jgi:hypothetical protein